MDERRFEFVRAAADEAAAGGDLERRVDRDQAAGLVEAPAIARHRACENQGLGLLPRRRFSAVDEQDVEPCAARGALTGQ
jgi:hypothetical protein